MPPERWQVDMFGGIRVRFHGRELTHFEMRRSAALLARLCYWPRRTHSREELTEMLWPEEDAEITRQRFRQVLSTLRRALQSLDESSDQLLLTDRLSLRLDPGLLTTDVAEFEQAVRVSTQAAGPSERAESLLNAVRLYRGNCCPATTTIGYLPSADAWPIPMWRRSAAWRRPWQNLATWTALLPMPAVLSPPIPCAKRAIAI